MAGPLHVVEVGASAGLNLRFGRYGYLLGGRQYGDPDSPVQLATEVYGPGSLPDLDRMPVIGRVQGVDLNPVDATDPDAREWLEALVWPENSAQRELLGRTLALAAADPVPIRAVGETGPLWWLSIEHSPDPDPRPRPARPGAALLLRDPAGHTQTVAVVDGHLRWIETLETAAR